MTGNAIGNFTQRRGHFRGFVKQSVNHQIRWPWRIIDLTGNQEVAIGVEATPEAGIAKLGSVLRQLAR